MPFTTGPGATIYFEVMGDASATPLLLVQGYTAQLVGWRDGFCRKLVERGMCVIRFDNRDVGLSERFGGVEVADAGYDLSDMADDGLAVLDALGLQSAHVVGQSMGGMIAQKMVDQAPQRVNSLSLIYTAPRFDTRYLGEALNQHDIGAIEPRLSRADAINAYVERERICASPAYTWNAQWIRELGGIAYDRGYAPEGNARQGHAMARATAQFADWDKVGIPVSIIHGRADGLIKVDAALALGAMIKQSELHTYPGMGHELVEPLWEEFANIIERTVFHGAGR
jgi:pimeloyl-ACP methyl ester carboxylesterase